MLVALSEDRKRYDRLHKLRFENDNFWLFDINIHKKHKRRRRRQRCGRRQEGVQIDAVSRANQTGKLVDLFFFLQLLVD